MNHIYTLAIILTISLTGFSQNWTGAVSTDWNNAANWSSSTLPSDNDDIVIDPANYTGQAHDPSVVGAPLFIPGKILVQNGAELEIDAFTYFLANDRVDVIGEGSLLRLVYSSTFALNGSGSNGRLTVSDGGNLYVGSETQLILGERLIFETGGEGSLDGGTITVGETFVLADGNTGGSSRFTQYNGTVTINGELTFENELGAYYPTYQTYGGHINVNGDLVWLGIAPGAGRGYFLQEGSDLTVTGTIFNDPASTMGMQMELIGGIVEMEGTSVTTLSGDSIVMTSSSWWTDHNAVVWQNDGVFFSTNQGYFWAGTQTNLNGNGSYQFGKLVVDSGKQLTHTSPGSISISSLFQGDGQFNPMSNRVILNGTVTEYVSIPNFAKLTINNPEGINLNVTTHVSEELDLMAGRLYVQDTLIMPDNAVLVNGSSQSFVQGKMVKIGNDAFLFPFGKLGNHYRPLQVSAPASVTTVLYAAYDYVEYDTLTPVQAPLQAMSIVEYWDLQRWGSNDLVSVSAGWNRATPSGLGDCSMLSLGVWDGAQWNHVPSGTTGLCSGNNSGTVSSIGQLPLIGPVTIGYTEQVTLWDEFICSNESFTVGSNTYTNTGVYVDVLQDVNGNDSLVVTQLTEGPNIIPIAAVNSAGTVAYLTAIQPSGSSLQWVDCNNGYQPVPGATNNMFIPSANGSYACVITNGQCDDTTNCVVFDELGVDLQQTEALVMYPNPLKTGEKLFLETPVKAESVRIFSTDGREVPIRQLETNDKTTTIELAGLMPGVYQLQIRMENGGIVPKRFVVE